jgi:hypothetical protein
MNSNVLVAVLIAEKEALERKIKLIEETIALYQDN